jgi:hypothetical protein
VALDVVIQRLGKYLRAVGLSDVLGIIRPHHHFKLNPGELVQLSLGSSVDDPTMKVNADADVAHVCPIELTRADAQPIPYMWAYEKTAKKFFPMQFFDGSNTTMQHRFNELYIEKRDKLVAFLDEFVSQVQQTGTEDDLGFYMRYEHLMKLDTKMGEGLLELTDVNSRRQWMTPVVMKTVQATLAEKQKIQVKLLFSLQLAHNTFL